MSVSRKCPKCHHWNTDRDYCAECNTYLNIDAVIREKEVVEIKKKIELNTDRIDRFIEKLSKSETFGGRMAYYIVQIRFGMWLFMFPHIYLCAYSAHSRMNKRLAIFLFVMLFIYACCYVLKQLSFSGILTSYVNDFLSLPIILTLLLMVLRKLKNDPSRLLSTVLVLFAFLYQTLLFEFFLPNVSERFTYDVWDIVAYGVGGIFFYNDSEEFSMNGNFGCPNKYEKIRIIYAR